MKFSSLATLEVVKMATSGAASHSNFINMTTFPFQWATLQIFMNLGLLLVSWWYGQDIICANVDQRGPQQHFRMYLKIKIQSFYWHEFEW